MEAKIGGAIPTITEAKIKEFAIALPSNVEEINIIGQFFQKLDYLVSVYQRKHDKLADIKKAMLGKMFV